MQKITSATKDKYLYQLTDGTPETLDLSEYMEVYVINNSENNLSLTCAVQFNDLDISHTATVNAKVNKTLDKYVESIILSGNGLVLVVCTK